MNRTVPTANLAETAAEKDKRGRRASKLRPIDKGTDCDVLGGLRRLVREIERGELGRVTDVIMAVRRVESGKTFIRHFGYGQSQQEIRHHMATILEQEQR